jgi:hypothetical protein
MREQIAALQQSDSRGEGASGATSASKANSLAIWAIIVVVAVAIGGGVASLVFYLATRK